MHIDLNKFGIIVLSSTIMLSGCLQKLNETPEPTEDPVEEPSTNNPDNPDLTEDPSLNPEPDPTPDLGNPESPVDPAPEPIQEPEQPVNGEESMPYASGTQLYGIKESESGSPNLIREVRNISGTDITYDVEKLSSLTGSWISHSTGLPFYIMGDDGNGNEFVKMKPENYILDTSAYNLSVDGFEGTFNILHTYHETTSQGVKDFVVNNLKLPVLGQFIDDAVVFDSAVYTYKETLEAAKSLVMFYQGNNDGVNCQLTDGTSLTLDLSSTGNCNAIVDGSLNAIPDISSISSNDFASAPALRMTALVGEDLRLSAHNPGEISSSGDVHLASDPDDTSNIGYYQPVTGMYGEYLEVVITDLQTQTYFDDSSIPWKNVTKLALVDHDGYVRIAAVVSGTTTLDNDTYLLNNSGLQQVIDSINW